MEISGRKHDRSFNDNFGKSSAEDGKVLCQPCSSDREWVVARGYCRNCNEYFCAGCIKFHRKQAMSKNHSILEGESMPKEVSSVTLNACSELCVKHSNSNEITKYYCPSHDVVGCGDCMVLDHKACKTDRIQDISRNYFNGAEHQNLQQKVDQFLQSIEQVNKAIKTNEETMQQTYSKAEHDIKAFKKEIIDYLNKAEADMLAELKKRKHSDEELISSLKENEMSTRHSLLELQEKLHLQISQANGLFVAAKEVKERINCVSDTIKQLEQDCHIKQYEFVCSKHISEILAAQYKLGELVVKSKIAEKITGNEVNVEQNYIAKMEPQIDCEIGIKTSDDWTNCTVFACALISSGQIALADVNNKCVKIVDIENRCISARYKLKGAPKSVAVVTASCIAVAVPGEGEVVFLAISQNGELSQSRTITVNGGVQNIVCKYDKLICLFNDHVEIRNINGKMVKSFSHPSLNNAMDIAFAHDSKTYYISNGLNGAVSVLKFDFDGNLIATYSDKDLSDVRGISVTGDGTVLVCNWDKNGSIHIISPECKKIREILKESEHVRHPWCVSFCDESNKLFLYNFQAGIEYKLKNVLKVFQLK